MSDGMVTTRQGVLPAATQQTCAQGNAETATTARRTARRRLVRSPRNPSYPCGPLGFFGC